MERDPRAILFAYLFLGLCVGSVPTHAQRTSGAVGFGGQLGTPTGVTLKIYNANGPSYDFLAAWDLVGDRFFVNAHALFETDLEAENFEPDLEWFVGPGGFVGFSDAAVPAEEGGLIGISGTIGLSLTFSRRVELYGRLTPRISLVPETEGWVGGGLGLRYYF